MYELTRVRLHSVGPSAARYQDVVLDLRDVGRRITATTQESLFPTESSELIRRPSPASVLFLENGGGKSVLIKLIFSVVLPGRRQVVGTTNTRVLENFVRAKDVSHVALEWQHTLTGARVVTGKVSEWRGHVVSSDPSKLADAWYSFRPTGSVTLDTLPLTSQGRLLTLSGFHDRLLEAHREAPELQLVWERGHSDWTEHLNSLGIDAELFRYQRAMNAGEGEAADAFSFKTDEAFVDFLLRAVTAEEDPRGLADVIDNYATRLAQRGGLQAERDFVVGALELLEPLARQESDAVAARRIAATARTEGERFAAEVALRHAREVDLLATLRAHFDEVSEQEQEADQEQRRRGAIVLELRRLVTQLRLRAAEKVKDDLEERLRAEQLRLDAWRETAVEIRFQAATEKVTRLAAIVSEQEGRAKPALAARDRAAGRLVRGLLWLAEQADEAAAQADGEAQACAEAADRLQADHDTAVGELQQQLAVKNAADERIAQARQDVSEQVRAGLLDEGADVAGAAERARAAEDDAARTLAQALAKLTELRNAHDVAVNALMAAERAATEADHAARQSTAELDLANARAGELASAARLADLLGSEDIVLDTDTPALLERLDDAVRTAEDERASLRAANLEDERALRALGTGGLLPPPEDVALALDVLEAAGITAWSGWQYLANVAPEEREATLTRFPHLVGGIVLNNAKEYERAEEVLAQARLLPRSVVAIGDTAAMLRLDMAPPHGIGLLVPPNPAMYDEAEAETERQAIAARHGQRQERLRLLTEQVAADQALVATLQAWRRDYPAGEVDRLAAAKAEADAARSEADQHVAGARRAEEEPRTEEARLRQDLPNLTQRETEARQRAQLLTGLADLVARIPQWTQESSTAGQLAEKARDRAEKARDQARTSHRRSGEYTRAADDHRRTASSCRDELRKVPGAGSVTAQDVVPTEPVEALRQAYESAAADYEKVRVGSDLLGELQVAQQVEAEARAALESVPAAVRAIVRELLRGPDGADEPARSAATARAQRAVNQYGAELGEANANVGALRSEFQRMARQSRSLEPYGAPKDIEHGERLIERATADWDAARTAHDKIDATKGELDTKVTAASRVVDGFQGLVDTLTDLAPELPDPDLAPLHGSLDDARQAHRAVRDNLTQAARRCRRRRRQSGRRRTASPATPRILGSGRSTAMFVGNLFPLGANSFPGMRGSGTRRCVLGCARSTTISARSSGTEVTSWPE